MILSDVLQKLDNIEKVPGKNDKRALLKSYLNNAVFNRCMKYMFNERMTYNIKELPTPLNVQPMAESISEIFKALDKLSEKRGATNKDKAELAALLGQGPTREVILRVVTGKSKAGFSARSVNFAKPGRIHQTPYQRCSPAKNLHRVSFPALAQIKADSMFAYNHLGEFISRKGKVICAADKHVAPEGFTLAGELMVKENKTDLILARKTGNGMLNKLAKTGAFSDKHSLVYKVWDIYPDIEYVSNQCSLTVKERWDLLQDLLKPTENMYLIPCEIVNDEAEAMAYADAKIAEGEEGAIIKDYNSLWKNNTAPDLVKLKNFKEAEFIVTGINEGEGKYVGMMGSIGVESSDGGICTNVGTGFSDLDRAFGQFEVGDIVTIKFESVITSKSRTETDSLNIPVFIEKREDKDKADTAKHIKNL